MQQDPTEHIAQLLMTKSGVKQTTYRNVCKVFKSLRKKAIDLINDINTRTDSKDEDIVLSVNEVSDQEFHVKIAGDLLVFFLHTNVVTLSKDYTYNKSPYVKESPDRKYLGQINVYNFMADTFKFNRMNDPGYLLARLMINYENRFIVEGDRKINFMFESISPKPIESTDLSILIQLIITQAIESDLVTPQFQKIRTITLQQKLTKTKIMGAGKKKIGFQMSTMQDAK
ncbi:MAG: hypothetical protein WBA74_07235 [Cyclobacteriaceae bacterium]